MPMFVAYSPMAIWPYMAIFGRIWLFMAIWPSGRGFGPRFWSRNMKTIAPPAAGNCADRPLPRNLPSSSSCYTRGVERWNPYPFLFTSQGNLTHPHPTTLVQSNISGRFWKKHRFTCSPQKLSSQTQRQAFPLESTCVDRMLSRATSHRIQANKIIRDE